MGDYDKAIIKVLIEAGSQGLSATKIARHVFNSCNSLFLPADFDDIYAYVRRYLQRKTKSANSLISKSDTRGIYRLNPDNSEGRQLLLQFSGEEDNAEAAAGDTDLSLSFY